MAANNFISGGTDNNWGTANNWSTGSVPTASDGNVATFTAASPNCIVNTSNRVCNHIDFTNYTHTITFTFQITVSGNITLGASMNFAGAAGLLSATAGNRTSNGKTCPQPLTLTGSVTHTFIGNWINSALVTLGSGTATTTINWTTNESLDCQAGLTIGGTTAIVTGTALIRLTGTGQWQGPSAGGGLKCNLTIIAGGGTITVSTTVYYNTGTLTYTSGTMTMTSSTLTMSLATTLDTANMIWNNVTISANVTITISSELNLSGTLLESVGGCTFSGHDINAGAWTISGGTTVTTTFNDITITITGLLTLSNSTQTTFTNNLNPLVGSCTISGTQTVVISTSISVTGTLTISAVTVLNGASSSWDVGGLTVSAALTGTSTIMLTGGIWQGASYCACNLIFAGNVTISGTVYYSTVSGFVPTMTYSSGTITTTSSTLVINYFCILYTAGITWNNITLASTIVTLDIEQLLVATGTLTLPNAAMTFAGAAGFTVGTLTNTTIESSAKICQFATGITYTITNALNCNGASATLTFGLYSVSANNTFIILGPGATQDLGYVNATHIDSSGGQKIFSYKGSINSCLNWITSYPVNYALIDPQHNIGI